jgi:hypothetical protein
VINSASSRTTLRPEIDGRGYAGFATTRSIENAFLQFANS